MYNFRLLESFAKNIELFMKRTPLCQVYTLNVLNVFNVTLKVPFVKQCSYWKIKTLSQKSVQVLICNGKIRFFFPYPSFNHIQSSPHEATAENVVQGPVIRGPTEFLFVWPWEKGRISIKILSWVP